MPIPGDPTHVDDFGRIAPIPDPNELRRDARMFRDLARTCSLVGKLPEAGAYAALARARLEEAREICEARMRAEG